MKVRTEKLEVVGILTLERYQFDMLQVEPIVRTVPWYMKDAGIHAFYVVGSDGFAKNVYVKGNFVIEPVLFPYTHEVKFLIEEVTDADTSAEPLAAQ